MSMQVQGSKLPSQATMELQYLFMCGRALREDNLHKPQGLGRRQLWLHLSHKHLLYQQPSLRRDLLLLQMIEINLLYSSELIRLN